MYKSETTHQNTKLSPHTHKKEEEFHSKNLRKRTQKKNKEEHRLCHTTKTSPHLWKSKEKKTSKGKEEYQFLPKENVFPKKDKKFIMYSKQYHHKRIKKFKEIYNHSIFIWLLLSVFAFLPFLLKGQMMKYASDDKNTFQREKE